MPAFRYVSENPFRLLGVGSATPWKTVRRKARDAEKAVAVGLAQDTVPTGLRGDFGANELENIVSRVAALESDPVERTIYRIFWPVEYDASKNSETNISNFAPRGQVEGPKVNGASLCACQKWFLENWFWFIQCGSNEGWANYLVFYPVG